MPAADVAHRPVEDRQRASGRESRTSPGRPLRRRPCRTATPRSPRLRPQYSGQKSVSLPGAISTPPACMPTLRVRPSSCSASSSSSRISSSLCSRSRRARGSISRAFGQRNQLARRERDQLGELVDEVVGQVEHPADVAHHRLRRHGAEGGDLRHRCGAVLLLHVLDHPVAAVLAEVDVEVGHRHPLRVEKALEQQVVAQRVEVGDAERIGHQRAGAGAAPRADRHAVDLAQLMKSATIRK